MGDITKTYRLTCVITEGDPYMVANGDKFIWSRDEFRSDTNALETPPVNLEALQVNDINALLTWVDKTQLGIEFVIRIRRDGSNSTGDIYYSDNLTTINDTTYAITYTTWGLVPGSWRWSVCTIFDTKKKQFTMWSEESLLIIK